MGGSAGKPLSSKTQSQIASFINDNKVAVISKSYCPYCTRAKQALSKVYPNYKVIEIENNPECQAIQDYMSQLTGGRSVPRVFINGKFLGGGDETAAALRSGKLAELINQ